MSTTEAYPALVGSPRLGATVWVEEPELYVHAIESLLDSLRREEAELDLRGRFRSDRDSEGGSSHRGKHLLAHDSGPFALRTTTGRREDARVGIPTTLKSVPDRWHLYRVVS